MALYIDSADREEIARLWASGAFAGVTTNPAILARAGLSQEDLPALVASLRDLGVETIYAQVLGVTTEEMLSSAAWLRTLGPLIIKVPATATGLAAARALREDGAEVLLTAVYHPVQAIVARDLGLAGVAPYVGRMSDAGRDGLRSVIRMQEAIGDEPTRVLAASLRSLDDVVTLAAAGVPDFTLGAALAREVVEDELTRTAAEDFEAAARQAARTASEG